MSDMIGTQENYVIVTPVKNEGVIFSSLVQSMASQTLKPVLWVIVDDGSTDNTPEIIRKAQEEYNWILSIQMNSSKRDLGLHIASVIRTGFDFAIEYCKKNRVDYSYLGNVDGDLTLEHTFFANLIKEFEKDPELGIASGGTNHIIGDKIIHAKLREDEPSGGHMLIRKRCFEECGGILLTYAWDSVLKAKARLRGWNTKRFEDNIATEIRDVCSAEGYWKGFFHSGKSDYYLSYNPIHVLIKGIIYSFKKNWYTGFAYLAGYLDSIMRRERQIEDKEIKKYFWGNWKSSCYKHRLFQRRH